MKKESLELSIQQAKEWNQRTQTLDISSPQSLRFFNFKKIILRLSRLFMAPQSEVNKRVLDSLSLITEEIFQLKSEIQPKTQEINLEIQNIYERLLGSKPAPESIYFWEKYINMYNIKLDRVESEISISTPYISKTLNQCKTLVQLPDFQIYAMMNDNTVGHEMILNKRWEEHITSVFLKTIKNGDVFIDIGANIGYFSLLAASILKGSGKVIAFEPNYMNVQLLLSSINKNQFSNVIVYPLAASDTNTIMQMDTGGSNGQITTKEQPSGHLFLQSIILDQLLASEQRIDIIKIDVELHEPFVLRGINKIIKKHRPIIFTEFHPRFLGKDYLEEIMQYNYRLSIIDDRLENLGKIIESPSANFIIDFWQELNSPSKHLDLFAQPN